jgi:hypothetical protein
MRWASIHREVLSRGGSGCVESLSVKADPRAGGAEQLFESTTSEPHGIPTPHPPLLPRTPHNAVQDNQTEHCVALPAQCRRPRCATRLQVRDYGCGLIASRPGQCAISKRTPRNADRLAGVCNRQLTVCRRTTSRSRSASRTRPLRHTSSTRRHTQWR